MNTLKTLNILVLALLGLAAGLAKVMQVPAEVQFFQGAGLGTSALLGLGIAQLLGGAGLLVPKFRLPAGIVLAATFAVSAGVIFINGNLPFGVVSLLPMVLAGYAAWDNRTRTAATNPA